MAKKNLPKNLGGTVNSSNLKTCVGAYLFSETIQFSARESQSGGLLRDTLPRSQIFHSHPVVPGLGGTSPHHGSSLETLWESPGEHFAILVTPYLL